MALRSVSELVSSALSNQLQTTRFGAALSGGKQLWRDLEHLWSRGELVRIRQALETTVGKLAESQSLLSAVLDNTNNGIIFVAPDLTVLYANRRMGEFFGIDVRRAIGQNKRQIVTDEMQSRMRDPQGFANRLFYLYDHLEETAIDEVEVAKPSRRILERYSAPVYGDRNQLLGRIEVYSDVTDVRQLQRNKDEFLSLVSHELRTPVTSIKGYAQLLQRRARGQELSETTMEAYATIERQAGRMQELIDMLLDLSRLETGRLQLQVSEVDLSALAARVVKMVQMTTDVHAIALAGPEHLSIEGDERRLEQVLLNLLSNAVHFSPEGGAVRVGLQEEDAVVRVTVSDEGVGIPPDAVPRVFERFYRADKLPDSSGMGIGLYIARSIADLHGGTLTVESELEQGSTFTLSLPSSPRDGEPQGAPS